MEAPGKLGVVSHLGFHPWDLRNGSDYSASRNEEPGPVLGCSGTRGSKDVDDATSLAARVTSHVTTLPAIDLRNEKTRKNACYLQDCVTTGVLLVEGMLISAQHQSLP